MEVRIFNRDFKFLGLVENYYSYIYNEKYASCGSFELHCPATHENLNLLTLNNLVFRPGDAEGGYIVSRELKKDIKNVEIVIVKGNFMSGYLNRRIIFGTFDFNTTGEDAIRKIINENVINPLDSRRKIPKFILGDKKGFLEKVEFRTSYKNTLEEIEKICLLTDLGFKTIFDYKNKQCIFDVIKGENRT